MNNINEHILVRNSDSKTHAEKINAIVSNLLQLQDCTSNNSYDLDCMKVTGSHKIQESSSDALKDLLMELNNKDINIENDNLPCYRCQHFLNIPKNLLFPSHQTISGLSLLCKADVSFVQAIVWLKSVTMITKQIPAEKLNLIFNNHSMNTDKTIDVQDYSLSFPTQSTNISVNNQLSENSLPHKFNEESLNSFKDIKYTMNEGTKKYLSDDIHTSQGSDYTFAVRTDQIIPESDCSDTPDMSFGETSPHMDKSNLFDSEKDDTLLNCHNYLNNKSKFSCSEVYNDVSNIIQNCPKEDMRVDNYKSQKNDSAYDTQCIDFSTDGSFLAQETSQVQTEDCEQRVQWKRVDTRTMKGSGSSERKQSTIFNLDTCNLKKQLKTNSFHSCNSQTNTQCWKEDILSQITQLEGRKRSMTTQESSYEPKKAKISSELLNFTMEIHDTNEIVFQSVKTILEVFQSEAVAKLYMKRKSWIDSLEAEAVNAILDFCDIYDSGKHSDTCTEYIVETIKKYFEKTFDINGLSKTSSTLYHTGIILELCNSFKVCAEIVDYLCMKLKDFKTSIIIIMTEQTDESVKRVHSAINILHILFFGLYTTLRKFHLAVSSQKENSKNLILTIIDYWKQDGHNDCINDQASLNQKKEKWITILEDFTLTFIEDFPHFAEKSRELSLLLIAE